MRRFEPRKHPRLPGFDYSLTNTYFVTIVAAQRSPRFGQVRESAVALNDAGRTVETFWALIPRRYPTVLVDIFVVMPDHLHGLLVFGGPPSERPSLSRVIQWFKTWTTNEYATGVREMGWEPFDGKLWQTGFYYRICRNEDDVARVRAYIHENPARRWQKMLDEASGQIS